MSHEHRRRIRLYVSSRPLDQKRGSLEFSWFLFTSPKHLRVFKCYPYVGWKP